MKDNNSGLGYTIKLVRTARDMSLKDLAQKMGSSNAYVSEIEAGKKNPSLAMLEKFSKALSIKKSTLLYLDEEGEKLNYNYQKLLLKILKTIGENETAWLNYSHIQT